MSFSNIKDSTSDEGICVLYNSDAEIKRLQKDSTR